MGAFEHKGISVPVVSADEPGPTALPWAQLFMMVGLGLMICTPILSRVLEIPIPIVSDMLLAMSKKK